MSHPYPPPDPEPDGEPNAAGDQAPSESLGGPKQDKPRTGPGTPAAKRFWSGRRVPAAITAALVLGLDVLFLQDIVSVRSGNRAQQWRRSLAQQLSTRHLDDTWIILGASVCAALGLWLLVLASTPGVRQVLPMTRRGPSGVRAGLDRRAAELVLRDRAMEVQGIRWAKVAVGRRRIKTHATSHFRDLPDVRADLDTALTQAVRQLGLARPPRLKVRLRRAQKNA
ncbi:DUF6286 domain-containing protein [Streptomyces sp. NPDC049040]|uniref:DUF6286 domain-containing protein n=1 Tax=Streptomyces sp. NPDC049040 TaxID=3365593 RepID=UPI00371128E9